MRIPEYVLMTGASGGIGTALAPLLAPARRMVLGYSSNRSAVEALAGRCLEEGAVSAIAHGIDLTSVDSIQRVADSQRDIPERSMLLVHNAGIIVKNPLMEQTDEEIITQSGVNFTGVMLLTKSLLPKLAHAAFIGSDIGVEAIPGMPVYCATKYAVRGFARALAFDYPELMVSCINPNKTATRMNQGEGHSVDKTARCISSALTGVLPPRTAETNFREYHLADHLGPPP
jgi:short-subunit dehydrogenase